MPLTTILVEDSPTIRDNLIPAMAELADVQVIAIAETDSEALVALEKYALRKRSMWAIAAFAWTLASGGAQAGSTFWPGYRGQQENGNGLQSSESASADGAITPPDAGGFRVANAVEWCLVGWMGRDKVVDVNVAVTDISTEKVGVAYSSASAK